MTTLESPVLLVIAGPNGAGKTTVTEQLRRDRWSEGVEYINPDEIARDRFGDWNSPIAVAEAARWASHGRGELLATGAGMAFETVFSAPDKLEFVARARRLGYFVRVFFVGTQSPTINAASASRGIPRPSRDVIATRRAATPWHPACRSTTRGAGDRRGRRCGGTPSP